jgi:hypothetical protein
MPTEIKTQFVAYQFTADEAPLAYCFSELQLAHLRTELSAAATERINLPYNPQNEKQYIMELEHIRGRMDALAALIATHEDTQQDLVNLIRDKKQSQQQE